MLYASYIASIGAQSAYGVDVDTMGTIWVTGWTNDQVFTALGGVGKTMPVGDIDGFLMGVNPQ